MNYQVCNTLAASTFLIWDYCITFDDEIEFTWRQKWSWVTAVFAIIRYVPIITSSIVVADTIELGLFPTSRDNCLGWLVAYTTSMMVLIVCLEVLLIARVLALYGQHRLLRYALITLSVCVNIARITLLSITKYKFVGKDGSKVSFLACEAFASTSIDPSAIFLIEFILEAILFSLAVFKLIHTKRAGNFAVSQLLVVIVRDGTWAFLLIVAFLIWIVLRIELDKERDVDCIWATPVIGFAGSRLILNLRSNAKTPPGGTNIEISEINFRPIDAAEPIHEIA